MSVPGSPSLRQRGALAAVLLLGLAGCAGQKADYASREADAVKIDLISVTPDYIQQQQMLSKAFDEQNDTIKSALATLNTQSKEQATSYRYIIGPADVLLISVPTIVSFNAANAPGVLGEQGQGYTVYDDGSIYLPFSGSVKVAGLTLREAQEQIVASLSKYLRAPQVIVAIREYRSQRVMVTGQLQKPGYQPITDVPLTVLGAVSNAGGISALRGQRDPRPVGGNVQQNQIPAEFPDLSHVMLKREGKVYELDVESILANGDVSQDVLLRDGDVVVVPATRRSSVVVMGEVLRPALYEVTRDDSSLAQVLMAAGGINQLTANARRVYVIRGDFKRPTIFQVDARSPDALLLAQKFVMEPKDVVFVAEAPIARWNRALQQILPTVQGLLSTAIIANTVDDLKQGN